MKIYFTQLSTFQEDIYTFIVFGPDIYAKTFADAKLCMEAIWDQHPEAILISQESRIDPFSFRSLELDEVRAN